MKFRSDIQGLRALAVLLVIAHHFFPETVTGGFFGVDIFFVISGYIITSTLLESSQKTLQDFLLEFYARRVRRIIPTALLVIVISVGATFILLGSITGSDTARDGIFASLFIANIHFNSSVVDYFATGLPQPILQHYWSLAVEEQFYLLWPLLFFLSRKPSLRFIIVVALSVSSFTYAFIGLAHSSPTVYLSTLTRVWELGAGAIIALSSRRLASTALSNISATALIVLSLFYTPESDFPGLPALVIVLLTCGVVINSRSNRFLSSGIMTWIGDRSYTLYLVHWPVFQIAYIYRGTALADTEKLALLILLAILSALIFKFIENPLRHSEGLKRSSTRSIVLGLSATLVTILALISLRSLV